MTCNGLPIVNVPLADKSVRTIAMSLVFMFSSFVIWGILVYVDQSTFFLDRRNRIRFRDAKIKMNTACAFQVEIEELYGA